MRRLKSPTITVAYVQSGAAYHIILVEDYVESLESKSTKEQTKREVNLLEKVLRNEESDEREVQNIELTKLNKHLADCIRSVRRKDGEDYEPSSLSLKKINKNLNLTNVYQKHNTIWKVLCTVFTHFVVFIGVRAIFCQGGL